MTPSDLTIVDLLLQVDNLKTRCVRLHNELRDAESSRQYWQEQAEREREQRQMDVGVQEYRGNTVSYIYDKCANYGAHFDRMNREIASLKAELVQLNP